MPLSVSDLKNSIRDLSTPATYAEAARLWAAAYASYAAQAISPWEALPRPWTQARRSYSKP